MQDQTFTSQQIEQIRKDTPGAGNKIHFNNAGTSLPVSAVVDTVISYLNEEALMGGYETEEKYQEQLNETYKQIGRLINAGQDEIALVENASTGWCIAFHGIDFKEGDEVIISELEYVTNMIGFMNAQKLYGIRLIVISNDENGNFSLTHLEEAINENTKLIAVTHVASATGNILPVEAIGRIAAQHGILYLLDACQSVGQMPVDVQAIGCHFLSVTGRKYLRAPRGTGFLYVKREVQDKLKTFFIDGHAIEWINEETYQPRNDAKRFEFYEKNRALSLGLGKAVEYATNLGMERIRQRIKFLSELMRSTLSQQNGVKIHDTGTQLSGIVTFSLSNMSCYQVKLRLAAQQINVSVAFPLSTPLFMKKQQLDSVVRASVHYYNTEAEIQLFCEVIRKLSAESQS